MSVTLAVNRRLFVWKYSVSHKQLLLLGPSDDDSGSRLYILLKAVRFLSVPTDFLCDSVVYQEGTSPIRYEFLSGAEAHYVLADYIFIGEDDRKTSDPVPIGIF